MKPSGPLNPEPDSPTRFNDPALVADGSPFAIATPALLLALTPRHRPPLLAPRGAPLGDSARARRGRIALAKLLDEGRVGLYFDALHIDSLRLIGPLLAGLQAPVATTPPKPKANLPPLRTSLAARIANN